MIQFRNYGKPPYTVAVIHGGPGAGGEMAAVARELSSHLGILEPIQTATTLNGQVEELIFTLEKYASPPVVLVGYSWGAWLSCFAAVHSPKLVRKLILVSSPPFEEQYTAVLLKTRFNRLSPAEQAEFNAVLVALNQSDLPEKDAQLARLGALAGKADHYAALPEPDTEGNRMYLKGAIFQDVWEEAANLRRSGDLLVLVGQIDCPVTAIHGDYDPHPADGVSVPLSNTVKDFRFILLEKCGHTPWQEKYARDTFFETLRKELL
jgi:pimeloyl-ACP methyl ester carboxylesterase